MSDERCPACGHKITSGRKTFEGYMARLFLKVVQCAGKQQVSWKEDLYKPDSPTLCSIVDDVIVAKDVRDKQGAVAYARMGDLKYWNLLEQREGWWHQGIYVMTDLARRFLNGETGVPRYVDIKSGGVYFVSSETILLREACGSRWHEIADWINDWQIKYKTWTDPMNKQPTLFP